jgi:hypothetical protein
MRKVKQGVLPPRTTNVRKALDAVEDAIIADFGRLNALQLVEVNLLKPLLVWWFLHPGIGENGQICSDFKWIHCKIEKCLQRIADLADKQRKPNVPSLQDYLEQHEAGKK